MSSLPQNFESSIQPMSSGLRRTTSNGNVRSSRIAQHNDALIRVPLSRIRNSDSGIYELFNSPRSSRSRAMPSSFSDIFGSSPTTTISIADSTTRVTAGFNAPDVTPSVSGTQSENSVDVCNHRDVFTGVSNVLVSNELRNDEELMSSDDEQDDVAINVRRSNPVNILARPKGFIKKYQPMDPNISGVDSVCAEIMRVCDIYKRDEYPYNLSAYDVWAQQNGEI